MNPLSKLRRLPLSKHQSSPIRSLALQLACFRAPGTLEPAQCLAQRLVLMAFHDELVCAQTASRGARIQENKSSEPLGPLTTTFPPSGWCLGSVSALLPPLGTEHGASWSSPSILTVNITSSEIVHLPLSVPCVLFPSPFPTAGILKTSNLSLVHYFTSCKCVGVCRYDFYFFPFNIFILKRE